MEPSVEPLCMTSHFHLVHYLRHIINLGVDQICKKIAQVWRVGVPFKFKKQLVTTLSRQTIPPLWELLWFFHTLHACWKKYFYYLQKMWHINITHHGTHWQVAYHKCKSAQLMNMLHTTIYYKSHRKYHDMHCPFCCKVFICKIVRTLNYTFSYDKFFFSSLENVHMHILTVFEYTVYIILTLMVLWSSYYNVTKLLRL